MYSPCEQTSRVRRACSFASSHLCTHQPPQQPDADDARRLIASPCRLCLTCCSPRTHHMPAVCEMRQCNINTYPQLNRTTLAGSEAQFLVSLQGRRLVAVVSALDRHPDSGR